ncbi:MAG: MATE family efflux transporter [Lawsonibacter sp.]|nr:MATE family efflux transporter [Lawsonibacter sp.]
MAEEHNPLGTMPITRLVVNMSWPIMLSMLVQAIYNLVDSIYVTRISDTAFLALSYAYPIQLLMAAFCVGVGVGFNAVLAQRLGAKKPKEANLVVLHGFLLYALCWLLFFLFSLLACEAYLRFCTGTEDVVWQGTAYLRICCCFSFGMCIQFPCERILQSAGYPVGFMIIQGSGALLNMILDPIFIFGFHMGVQGAAVATVIGQIIGGFVGVFLVRRIRFQFPITFKGVSFQPKLIREIWDIAAPAILMQSLSSLMSLGLNSILNLCSETAVWVLGVYFKLQSFVFMPIFSINNALVSIISYNYGAKDKARVFASIRSGLLAALSAGLTGTVLLWMCAAPLLTLCFRAGQAALTMGVSALRMTALAFPVAAISITRSAAFQSLGYSRYSLLLGLLRNVIFLLPIALLLVLLSPQWAFFSFFLSETAACLVSWGLFRQVKQRRIDLI